MTVDLSLDSLADDLAERLAQRIIDRDQTRVGPTAAARALGYPRDYFNLSRHPERVPYFGARGVMWPTWKWQRWNEVPEGARLRQWDAIPLCARSKIVGAA